MQAMTSLYNILIDLAFFNQSEYSDINEFIFNTKSSDLLIKGCQVLFDFDFPTPSNIDKNDFLNNFYLMFSGEYASDNIAFDTADLFKIKIISKTLEIMPYYSKKLEILYNISLNNLKNTREITRENQQSNSSESKSFSNSEAEGNSKTLNSEQPNGLLIADDVFKSPQRLSNGSASNDTTNSKISAENSTDYSGNENEKITEISGNFLDSLNNLSELKDTLKSLINEYSDLFSQIF